MPFYADREAWRADRNHRISELLTAGHTHAEIGQQLGISGPAVTHWISGTPELRHLRHRSSTKRRERLRTIRQELAAIKVELESLRRQVRLAATDVDQEIATIDLDRELGLR